MKAPTYGEQLKDPKWQRVRLKKLEAAEWRCQHCYDTETMLSVHHKRYVKGRMAWEYNDHELVVLCQPCHELEHGAKNLRSELLVRLPNDGPGGESEVFAVAAGYCSVVVPGDISQVASEFDAENPYCFALGRFAGALSALPLRIDWLNAAADALTAAQTSDSAEELVKLFRDVGALGKGFTGSGDDA